MSKDIQIHNLKHIVENIKDGNCVFFLGAGASFKSEAESPPLGKKLSNEIADICKEGLDDYPPDIKNNKDNLLRTSLYYQFVAKNRKSLNKLLTEKFSKQYTPNALHDVLVNLKSKMPPNKPCIIITTNYDKIIEDEMDAKKIDYNLIYSLHDTNTEKWKIEEIDRTRFAEKPTIYKFHGCLKDPLGMIITEHDYGYFLHDYLEQRSLKPHQIESEFSDSSFVFVGYGMEDLDFRVIFQSILTFSLDKGITHFGVTPHISDLHKKYWQEHRKIQLIEMTADDFGKELKKELNIS
jgi:hypothetical protein